MKRREIISVMGALCLGGCTGTNDEVPESGVTPDALAPSPPTDWEQIGGNSLMPAISEMKSGYSADYRSDSGNDITIDIIFWDSNEAAQEYVDTTEKYVYAIDEEWLYYTYPGTRGGDRTLEMTNQRETDCEELLGQVRTVNQEEITRTW